MDGCDETLEAAVFGAVVAALDFDTATSALVFGAADSVGFGADAVDAPLIGGELPGVPGIEDVALASFGADVLGAGFEVFLAAPLVALDEVEAGGTG